MCRQKTEPRRLGCGLALIPFEGPGFYSQGNDPELVLGIPFGLMQRSVGQPVQEVVVLSSFGCGAHAHRDVIVATWMVCA